MGPYTDKEDGRQRRIMMLVLFTKTESLKKRKLLFLVSSAETVKRSLSWRRLWSG